MKLILELENCFWSLKTDFERLKLILELENWFLGRFFGAIYIFHPRGICVAPLCGFLGGYKNQG
ncbi:MAG: hypothetical protein SR3Q1_02505 [Quinella sp. 3Q1]|nr:hypothetical protein [Quinella sp. 3Q1]